MDKIGIIDADLLDNGTRHPNLALMKIAGFYKDKGEDVELIRSYDDVKQYKQIFMSKVFTFTEIPDDILELNNIQIGGTGFFEDGGENLPDEIEHHRPYYDLYKEYVEDEIKAGKKRSCYADYLEYSIGFTTRGCFRKCSFCVNKKYDHVFPHSPLQEFLDTKRPYIYLWDDNILAYPKWKEVVSTLEETGKPFQFRQGIDLRLMTDEKAKVFNKVRYKGDFIFAFDHLKDKELIEDKVQLWKRYSTKVCKMYVLSGYDSQDEKDIESVFKRIKSLMTYGSLPYIMRYEDYKKSEFRGIYVELARWCNQPQFFKKKSFREFCIANQEYKKLQDTNCAAYRNMLEFEQRFPDIAKEYFDLKFEKENIYSQQYGYGRKYANKPNCRYCKKQSMCLKDLVINKSNDELIKLYFTKEIDLLCLEYMNAECSDEMAEIVEYMYELIKRTKINDIIRLIKYEERENITKDNIPQYSDIKLGYLKLFEVLKQLDNHEGEFEDIGYYLYEEDVRDQKSKFAKQKYGENHAKLACLLDLVQIGKKGIRSVVRINKFGEMFNEDNQINKEEMFAKLSLRVPIIQNRVLGNDNMDNIFEGMEVLSKKTSERRRSNVETMVKLVTKYSE